MKTFIGNKYIFFLNSTKLVLRNNVYCVRICFTMSNQIKEIQFKPTHGNSKPIKPLLETVIGRIQQGDLKDGDRLPPLRTFAKEHGISLRIARSVFGELSKAGFVRSIQGDGTYVSTKSEPFDHSKILSNEVHLVLQHRPYVSSSMVRMLINELQTQGYLVMVLVEHADEDQKKDFIDLLEKRWNASPPAAIVMEGRSERIDRLVKQCVHPCTKVIATFRHPTWIYPGWHSVQLDVAGAHYFATKKLLEQGHKNIAVAIKKHRDGSDQLLMPERSQMINSLCLSGASHAVADFGLEEAIQKIGFEKAKDIDEDAEPNELENLIIRQTVEWLEEHSEITAIVGQEPWLWYVKIAASILKKKIPDDLAIVGIGKANPAYRGEYPCLDWCYTQMAKEVSKITLSDRNDLQESTRHVLIPSKWVDIKNWQNGIATSSLIDIA